MNELSRNSYEDSDQEKESASNSLLSAHLGMISGETNDDYKAEKVEVDEVRNLKWSQLNLIKPQNAPRNTNLRYLFTSVMALAATVAVVMSIQPKTDDVSIKGSSKFFVVVERKGETKVMTGPLALVAGDRVNVEVASGEPLIAFIGVFDRKGNSLSTLADVELNLMRTKPGAKAHFERAIELTTENDGEQIVVAACNSKHFEQRFPNVSSFVKLFFTKKPDASLITSVSELCQIQTVQLRE